MAVFVGRLAKVMLGANKVAELGNWTMDGIKNEVIDIGSFGDTCKHFIFGTSDFGTVKFSGSYDMSDTNGQLVLWTACLARSALTDIKFYINSTSYYTPDLTTDSSSQFLLTSISPITFDKAGVGTITFTGQVSGRLGLV